MKKLLTIITICILSFSCTKENKIDSSTRQSQSDNLDHEIDYRAFKIKVPEGWEKIELQGIDSYVGGIVTNHQDTITFDLGWYSNRLNDEEEKHLISDDTVDHYKVKIVKPKNIGYGITGIYIDSLWESGSGISRFNLYGNDLCLEDHNNLLKAIRTIQFDKKDQIK